MFKAPEKRPHRHEVHGDVRLDDYFWMRERDTEPVMEFLRQENRRTEEALAPVKDLEQKLYLEMRSRIKEDDSSVPVWDSGYLYYTRFEAGKEYEIHCRRKSAQSTAVAKTEGLEQVILDENILASGHTYFDVGHMQCSPDQRYLAYAADVVGRRIYTIYFVDLETGQTLDSKVEAVTPNFVWAADNKTIFFVRQDAETLRAFQVYRYALGDSQPELVYEEMDTTFSVSVAGSKLNTRLFLACHKRDSAEWRVLPADQPRGNWEIFWPREDHHEYSLVDGGDRLFILTNWQARNFRLMEAALQVRQKKEWREVIAHNEDIFLEDVDAYRDFLVVSERENGLTQIRIRDRQTNRERALKFSDPVYEVAAGYLPDYNSPYLRFRYESLVQPPTVYDETVATKKRETRKVREVPGYDPSLYESKRMWATGQDGTQIPMSVVMKKGVKTSGQNPTLLYGYGSYGLSTTAHFRSSILSLLDRGFVFAIGHVRGGSEMGRDWYEKGRLKYKMNSFTDFIACAEKLIGDGYTSSAHLHIMGGSAGGLLMGAVMNLRPELFRGVIAAVPFVDVLTTMLDESIPLTTGEYKEWGDPRVPEEYGHMRQYSPYDNLKPKAYPNLLVTTGYHDSQVQYWEPAKWVARLQDIKTDSNLLLLYTELDAGHSGATGRFEALKTLAKEYAFILLLEGIRN